MFCISKVCNSREKVPAFLCTYYFRLLPKYYFSNHDFLLLVKNILLLCGCVETNPRRQQYVHRKTISIVHNNVCSLLPKIDTISNELSGNDIIAITETHLDDSILMNLCFLMITTPT